MRYYLLRTPNVTPLILNTNVVSAMYKTAEYLTSVSKPVLFDNKQ